MQREKLYNFHRTAYFIVALSVFEMDKILSDQFSKIFKFHVFSLTNSTYAVVIYCYVPGRTHPIGSYRTRHYPTISDSWRSDRTPTVGNRHYPLISDVGF